VKARVAAVCLLLFASIVSISAKAGTIGLNALAPPGAPLYLMTACAINDAGVIVGIGVTNHGSLHGYMATPTP
jgi:hypothetical protein